LRVLHINQHLAPKGGVETYLLAALPHLRNESFSPIWLYAEGDASLWQSSEAFPDLASPNGARQKESLRGAIQSHYPDLIHVHNVQNPEVIEVAMNCAPTVLTSHDYRWICPANNFFFKRSREVCGKSRGDLGCFGTTLTRHCLTPRPNYAIPYYRRVQRMPQLHPRLARVIAPSFVARDRLVAAGWDDEKIEVLPYFCPLPPRGEPRPLPKPPTITYIGRIAPNKGQDDFVRALGQLPQNWKGIMAGDIDDQKASHLKELSKEAGCESRLELRPWAGREEVLQIMDQTTVLVFPSLWQETLGIVAIEALSRGVPVVATEIVGIADWLKDRSFGRIVAPKDPNGVTEAVLDLHQSEEQVLRAGWEGIQLINEQFLPEQHIGRLVRIYQEVLNGY